MQFSTCRSASAGDITSIRGDLGVNQDKLGHEAIEDVEGRRKMLKEEGRKEGRRKKALVI